MRTATGTITLGEARLGFQRARDGILDGTMHTTTAIGLLRLDPDWQAECDLARLDFDRATRAMVHRWQIIRVRGTERGVPTVRQLLAADGQEAA